MKLIGITRIRNEQDIISNTLDHVANLVDGVVVFDDCSMDNTVEICESHPIVLKVLKGKTWSSTPKGRNIAEGYFRHKAYMEAVRLGATWIYCFDGDEYAEFSDIKFTVGSYFLRLFDFYITEEDKEKNYLDRKWMGPEYRDIPMLFKVNRHMTFTQRIPRRFDEPLLFGGYVKHYGKAISVENWEQKCEYYTNHRWNGINQELWLRWVNRKGKAIHNGLSDFGAPLIEWDERMDTSKIKPIK